MDAMGLNLNGLREKTRQIKAQELADENGDDVKVNLQLPGGQEELATFKMGTLVSYIKAYIQQEYGHPMAKLNLLLEGSPMLDPLSLSDVPGLNQESVNLVRVSLRQQELPLEPGITARGLISATELNN